MQQRVLPILLLMLPTLALGQQEESTQPAGSIESVESIEAIVERHHNRINERLQNTSKWLDRYFGTERSVEDEASSIVRLGLNGDYVESQPGNTAIRLRGKVILPRLKRKLSLVFEGEPDNGDVTGLGDETASTELRYNLGDQLLKEASISLGLRGGLRLPTVFTRLRSVQRWQHDKWLLRATPAIEHDSRKGFTVYLRFDSEYRPREDQFYRSTTKPLWSETLDQLKIEQAFTRYYRLSHTRYLALDWLITLASKPNRVVETSRLRLRHRRALWRNRLYLEVAPGLRFTEANEHRLQWDGSIRLEWVFAPD